MISLVLTETTQRGKRKAHILLGAQFPMNKMKRKCLPRSLILEPKRKLRLLMLGHCSFQVDTVLFKFDKKFYIISKYFIRSMFLLKICQCHLEKIQEYLIYPSKHESQIHTMEFCWGWAICAPIVICLLQLKNLFILCHNLHNCLHAK